jgi:hypothetical protein
MSFLRWDVEKGTYLAISKGKGLCACTPSGLVNEVVLDEV